jgi:hypothetical protein
MKGGMYLATNDTLGVNINILITVSKLALKLLFAHLYNIM